MTSNTLADSEDTSDEDVFEDELSEEDEVEEAGDGMEVTEDLAKNPNGVCPSL